MQAVDPFPGAVRLGGVMDHLDAIRRCRRVLFVGCGTSYHACMACRQTIEQLTNMPVRQTDRPAPKRTPRLPDSVRGFRWQIDQVLYVVLEQLRRCMVAGDAGAGVRPAGPAGTHLP